MSSTQKITTFLLFGGNAEEAVNHYVSIVPDSKILGTTRYGAGGPAPAGSVMTMRFEMAGQKFVALNGPSVPFTEAVSLMVDCDSQAEVDRLWNGLSAGGQEGPCGWLKDKFGLSWQIVPSAFIRMVQDPDPAKSQRVMKAMMQMKKLDIAELERAHRGE